jgi:metal-sulfur cluster biosynthetic enzyme
MIMVEEKIREALRTVIDPELGVSIVDLGLIYDIRYEDGEAEVEMTLTSPGCPLAPVIDKKIKDALKGVPEIKKLRVELVWDPPWSKDLMSDELKAEYGF